ncbi:Alpha-ketoglutarate-dependent dioxygenase AlkB-like [Parasponia andersonii]|uniref:Alpha-ketoglutarate-dependent dioxygenase AlkB-like n=1 Tax=Parasponia andersonii TaxID=3476 RepID=A0A2P5ARL1_PARAD|nr:Alpha-ketoglutarate-dependent dioxygenase AlkB-like [Parasponia andersonii]
MADRRAKPADPFLVKYQPSELKIASEFLTTWLPFLSRDLCHNCADILTDRIRSLELELEGDSEPLKLDDILNASISDNLELLEETNYNHDDDFDGNSVGSGKDGFETNSLGGWKDGENGSSELVQDASTSEVACESPSVETPSPRMSWADMAQEDELEEEDGEEEKEQEQDHESSKRVVNVDASTGELRISKVLEKPQLSREQREYYRFKNVQRKKDFICLERVKGKIVNILNGLELHAGIFSAAEQKRIVEYVYMLEEKGRKKELKGRTYTAPQKWMRGKGRITIQFGCCYNYATDKNGNPPGILPNENVDPLPHLFKVIIRRLVRWHVLPPTCVPDSCIVNIYEEGDCIPPHIDNHDFVRPFCTVSFLSECNMVFGSNLRVVGAGDFEGSYEIPLPVGSVLVLNGNGADVARHCVPAVPTKRISITFRRMDESKRPVGYAPEPDLQGIQPLSYDLERTNGPKSERHRKRHSNRRGNNSMVGSGSGGRSDLSPYSETRYSNRGQRGPGNWRRSG